VVYGDEEVRKSLGNFTSQCAEISVSEEGHLGEAMSRDDQWLGGPTSANALHPPKDLT
jgi:hypothetical protein